MTRSVRWVTFSVMINYSGLVRGRKRVMKHTAKENVFECSEFSVEHDRG